MSNLQVTDRFDLLNEGRTNGNKRNYIVKAVQTMFESKPFTEGVRLGEHYGYFGHGRRQMAGKLDLPEVNVIMLEGKPVVLNNIPSNRTLAASCDDMGVVTHTQEILSTDTGKIVQSMYESSAGGWSWATGGRDGKQSVTRSYHGMDYVNNPNFISLDRPALMMESADGNEGLQTALSAQFGANDVDNINQCIDKLRNSDDLDQIEELHSEVLLLEGVLLEQDLKQREFKDAHDLMQSSINELQAIEDNRRSMLLEAVAASPFFISKEQMQALSSMKTEHDCAVVTAMFESFNKSNNYAQAAGDLDQPLYVNVGKKKPTKKAPVSGGFMGKKVRLFK